MMSDDGSGWHQLPPGYERGGTVGWPSLATGASEAVVTGEDAFVTTCRGIAISIVGEAKLLREQLTLSDQVGLIWRGDYEEDFVDEATGRPLVSRVMLFQMPGHPKGESGFVIYTGFLDNETPPLP